MQGIVIHKVTPQLVHQNPQWTLPHRQYEAYISVSPPENDWIAISLEDRDQQTYAWFQIVRGKMRLFWNRYSNKMDFLRRLFILTHEDERYGRTNGVFLANPSKLHKRQFGEFWAVTCGVPIHVTLSDNELALDGCVYYRVNPQTREMEWIAKNNPRFKDLFLERVDGPVHFMRCSLQNSWYVSNAWRKPEEDSEEVMRDFDDDTIVYDEDSPEYRLKIMLLDEEGKYPVAKAMSTTFNAVIHNEIMEELEGRSANRYAAFTLIENTHTLDTVIIFGPAGGQSSVLNIYYVSRMLQGLFWRFDHGANMTERLPNVDNLFKAVLRFNKAEWGLDTLAIEHATRGSVAMLRRTLTEQGQASDAPALLYPTNDERAYPIDFFKLQFRLCSHAICSNLATHTWPNAEDQYAFCGKKCAANIWSKIRSKK